MPFLCKSVADNLSSEAVFKRKNKGNRAKPVCFYLYIGLEKAFLAYLWLLLEKDKYIFIKLCRYFQKACTCFSKRFACFFVNEPELVWSNFDF